MLRTKTSRWWVAIVVGTCLLQLILRTPSEPWSKTLLAMTFSIIATLILWGLAEWVSRGK